MPAAAVSFQAAGQINSVMAVAAVTVGISPAAVSVIFPAAGTIAN